MRELLIIDCNMPETDETYFEKLEMGKETEIIHLSTCQRYDCGKVERAVFVPNFRTGGPYPYQIEQVLSNKDVGSWIVYAHKADKSVLKQYQIHLKSAASIFTDIAEVKAVLQTKAAPRESCLILTSLDECLIAGFAELMKAHLKTWQINIALLNEYQSIEAALQRMPASRVMLLGEKMADFDHLSWFNGLHPFVIIATEADFRMESKMHKQFIREVKAYMPDIAEDQLFLIHIPNELWKLEIKSGKRMASSMEMEPLFCMKDDFGLPSAPQAYRDEAAIIAYLDQYETSERIASKMKG